MSLLFQGTPDTGGGPGEQLLLDNFVGPDNSPLEDHIADTGQTWETTDGELQIYQNHVFLKTFGANDRAYVRSSLITTPDYKTVTNISAKNDNCDIELALHYLDVNNFVRIQVYQASKPAPQLVIDTVDNGVFTRRGLSDAFNNSGLEEYEVTCETVGGTITAYFNDHINTISYTWASATTDSLRVGVGLGYATNQAILDSFQVLSM